jgi:hypothetical protein
MTSKAQRKGLKRKARRHKAERRAATTPQREARNRVMRAAGHPGWVAHFNPNTPYGRWYTKFMQ